MAKDPTFKGGDCVIVKAQSRVLVNRAEMQTLDVDKECVVEACRWHDPGLRTDHFAEGEVADVRPLLAGAYDPTAPLYTIALSGDFEPTLICQQLVVTKRLQKTYIPAGISAKPVAAK